MYCLFVWYIFKNVRINITNYPGLVSESCHESTFKLIRHRNFNDVLFSVGATGAWGVIIQNVKKRDIFSIEKN
jgi:hypothetical protein